MSNSIIKEIDLTKLLRGVQKSDARTVKDELILICGTVAKYNFITEKQRKYLRSELQKVHRIEELVELVNDFYRFSKDKGIPMVINWGEIKDLIKKDLETQENNIEINIEEEIVNIEILPYDRLNDYQKGLWDMFQEAMISKHGHRGYSLEYDKNIDKVVIYNAFKNKIIQFDDMIKEFNDDLS